MIEQAVCLNKIIKSLLSVCLLPYMPQQEFFKYLFSNKVCSKKDVKPHKKFRCISLSNQAGKEEIH